MKAVCLTLLALITCISSTQASEEQLLNLQTVLIKSAPTAETGTVTIEAETDGTNIVKLVISAFEKQIRLEPEDLKKLIGFPLSSCRLTHEAGYPNLGGHTLHIRLSRVFYDKEKKLKNGEVIISVPKHSNYKISMREIPLK